jgi:ribonuclease HI
MYIMIVVTLYTDGGCSPNPGPGRFSFIAKIQSQFSGSETSTDASADENVIKFVSGEITNTTNNRMEITAVVEPITFLIRERGYRHFIVYTDSMYVVNGINNKVAWRKQFSGSHAKTKPNADLWLSFYNLLDIYDNIFITVHWVKGHAGNEFNEIADSLCSMAQS